MVSIVVVEIDTDCRVEAVGMKVEMNAVVGVVGIRLVDSGSGSDDLVGEVVLTSCSCST